MRVLSMVIAFITALVLAVVGYGMLTTTLGVEVTMINGEPASEQYEAFEMARSWAQDGNTGTVTRYTNDVIGDVSNYYIVYINASISNWCFLPAEWLQLSVRPAAGDILQIRQDGEKLDPMTTTPVQAVIVTANPDLATRRDVDIEYYIFGHKFTATSVAEQAA